MRALRWFPILLVVAAGPLAAQDPEPGGRAAELRQAIEERFTARVQEELGLTDPQADRLAGVARDYFRKRRDLDAEERRLRTALAGELRPGVAANPEAVNRLTEQLLDLKVRYAESYRAESRELGSFLTPVQRAQYFLLRERLLERLQEAQEARQQQGPLRRRRVP